MKQLSLWILASAMSVSPISLLAQEAPGGVVGSSTWYAAEDDPLEAIGNHHTFDLLTFEQAVNTEDLALDQASTLFFVLKPNFSSARGSSFMRMGDVHLFDDHISYKGGSVPLEFKEGEPVMVSLQIQRPQRYAWRSAQDISIDDAALFSLAELIVYPGILSREEVRKVSSYLALKYSITITENDDASWRDYWTANRAHYWDTRIDRLYKERVIGVGRSDDEKFLQTQTMTTSGDAVQIALDGFVPVGQNSTVTLGEDAFIIFSEKSQQSSSAIPCFNSGGKSHPLHLWKFKLQNWSSDAEYLYVRVKHELDKKEEALYLSNGALIEELIPRIIDADHVEYQIALQNLQVGMHYFFTNESGTDCDNVEFLEEDQTLSVFSEDLGDKIWYLETQSLNDGSLTTTQETGNTASRNIGAGQHVVSVLDENGDPMTSTVLYVDDEDVSNTDIDLRALDIRIYPNPVASGSESILSITHLPSEEPIRIVVSDAGGRIHSMDEMEYREHIKKIIALETPGMYTISVYQEDAIYAVKLIVRSK